MAESNLITDAPRPFRYTTVEVLCRHIESLASDALLLASTYGEEDRARAEDAVRGTREAALTSARELEAAREENCRLYRDAMTKLATAARSAE